MTFPRSLALAGLMVLAFSLIYVPVYVPQAHAQSSSVSTDLNLTFTTIDVPGAGYTGAFGINKAGDIVGNYGQNVNTDSHGFLLRGGSFTLFDYPGQTVTLASGINDSGLIVGYAGSLTVRGFLYDGMTFTTLRDGSNSATFALGLNNASAVVGGAGTVFTTTGFQMRQRQFKTLNVPGQFVYVYASGINNFGTIVGWTDNDGFVCRHGSCQIMDFPGASTTEARGVNDHGVIVGWYFSGPCNCGFTSKNGKYISFSYPGAAATFAAGINASGQVVGEYTFDFNTYHGFVTSPITSVDFERPGCCVFPNE